MSMDIESRLSRLEDSPYLREVEKERKRLRIMELFAIGALRLKKGLSVDSLAHLSENELLVILGTDKRGYEQALSGS